MYERAQNPTGAAITRTGFFPYLYQSSGVYLFTTHSWIVFLRHRNAHGTTGLRVAFIFYTVDLYWFAKLEVRILQSMHSEIFVTRQQALAAKARSMPMRIMNKFRLTLLKEIYDF